LKDYLLRVNDEHELVVSDFFHFSSFESVHQPALLIAGLDFEYLVEYVEDAVLRLKHIVLFEVVPALFVEVILIDLFFLAGWKDDGFEVLY
jgi:hypothetical protein